MAATKSKEKATAAKSEKSVTTPKVKLGNTEVGKVEGHGFSSLGQKKGNAVATTLPADKIKVESGFNPRTDLGDVSALVDNIKKEGLLQAIIVRPKGNHFNIVAGHRRYAACVEAGLTDIPVTIRFDLDDDNRALAVSVAENSEDGRQNLNYIEMGRAFAKLEKEGGMSVAVIAKETATHPQTVRRCLKVMEAPKDVQEKVEKGVLSSGAALEYARLAPTSRKAIADKLEEGMSAKRVKELGKQAAKESGADSTKGKAANKQKGKSRDAALVSWKGSKAKQEEIKWLAYLIEQCEADAEIPDDDNDLVLARGALTALLWDRGDIEVTVLPDLDEPPEGTTKADAKKVWKVFKETVKAEAAKYQPPEEEEEEEDGEAE